MPSCASCSTELDPLWKFCTVCGTPVVSAEPDAPVDSPTIPGAIRPDQPVAGTRARAIPAPAIVVIVLAAAGSIGAAFAAIQWLR